MAQEKETGTKVQSGGLLAELHSFNKKSLKQTETRIHTEDGKILRETRDDFGNYRTKQENIRDCGFIADECMDFQVGEIKDYLIFGSQDVAAEWSILSKYKVTHIINLGTYVKNFFEGKIKYKNININDTTDTKVLQYFDQAFRFIDEARDNGGCCFIHCNAGISRASTFVIGYLMKTDRMIFEDAFSYVKKKRPRACPNTGFMLQLVEYEKQLEISGKTKL